MSTAAELSVAQVLAQVIASVISISLSGVLQGLQTAQTNALNELRAGMADQNANLGNTTNAAIQVVGNENPGAQPVQPQVAFARNPGSLNPDAILNFERKGQTFYEKATGQSIHQLRINSTWILNALECLHNESKIKQH